MHEQFISQLSSRTHLQEIDQSIYEGTLRQNKTTVSANED